MQTIKERLEWMKEQKICEESFAVVSGCKDIKEYYSKLPDTIYFITRMSILKPDLALSILLKCVESKLLIDSAPPELVKAHNTLLDPNASKEEMSQQMGIAGSTKTNLRWDDYFRIVYYLLRWRLGIQNSEIAIPLQWKMWAQMKAQGNKEGKAELLTYMKSICPFEEWQIG